jgi:hypothetical protein
MEIKKTELISQQPEKTMIVFSAFGFCALYFIYLKKWAESFLRREYNFGSPSLPKALPHSPNISFIVAIMFGIFLLSGVFWGFTYVRYPDYLSVRGDKLEIILLGVVCVAIGLSYFVVYKLGEIAGVAHMKGTHLFRSGMPTQGNETVGQHGNQRI